MSSEKESLIVSTLAVIPVFAVLLANYAFFGLEIPTEILPYALLGTLTIITGLLITEYRDISVGYQWAIESGTLRWLFIIIIFSSKGITESFSTLDLPGSFSQLMTYQFLFELPAMIGGYLIAYEIYRRTR